jgi:ABC-type transport system substrate-binding protein
MNYAIPRKTIARALFGKYATPTSSPYFGSPGSDPKYDNYYSYDPAKARALLAAAGYPHGFTVKILSLGDWFDASFRVNDLTTIIAKYLGAVGIKVEVTLPATVSDYSKAAATMTNEGLCHILYLPEGSPLFTWPYRYGRLKVAFGDMFGWSDPVLGKLHYQASRAGKALARLEGEMIARSVVNAYFIPVAAPWQLLFVSKRVAGVKWTSPYALQPTDWSPA